MLTRALAALVAVALCLPARSEGTVDVTSAEALQTALEQRINHIRITRHINATGLAPQMVFESGAWSYFFHVAPQTQSITGACQNEPDAHLDLKGDWKAGMCLVHIPEHSGLLAVDHSGLLWLHRLYFLLSGTSGPDDHRRAIEVRGTTGRSSVYLTSLSLEARMSHLDPNHYYEILIVQSSQEQQLQLLASGLNIVANDASIASTLESTLSEGDDIGRLAQFEGSVGERMPRNATVSLLNSKFTSLYAPRKQYVTFSSDLRMENCSFVGRPQVQVDIFFKGRLEVVERTLYANDSSLTVGQYEGRAEVTRLGLAQSGARQRLTQGKLPFLTLEDPSFVALQAEVASGVPPPSHPPPTPPPPPSSLPDRLMGMVASRVSAQAHATVVAVYSDPSDNTPVGLIVGSVLAAVFLLVAVAAAVWFLRRRGALRWPCAADLEAKSPAQAPDAEPSGIPVRPVDSRAGPSEISQEDDNAIDNIVSMTTNSQDTIAQALFKHLSVTQTTTSSAGEAGADPVGSSQQPQAMRSDWVTMDPTRFETSCPITYVGPMTAGHAGVALGKEDQVHVLEEVLDRLHSGGLKLGNRWTVLSCNQRRVGGQGLVQFVRDEQREEYCAVKFFFDDATFEREAQLYARASVRDMMAAVVHMEPAGGPCPGLGSMPAWIVLERGSSLSDWAMRRKPDLLTSAQVMSQILERLERLHELGLVHRDIKPANILWREAAKAWTLIDFGCVVDTRECSEAPLSFSLPYAAPEVIRALERGDQTMPVRTSLDIWSIGVVVYELLMKARVFPLGCTAEDMKDQLAGREPLPWERVAPGERRSSFSKLGMLRKTVLACLSRDPESRPTAQQLLKTLEHTFSRTNTTND